MGPRAVFVQGQAPGLAVGAQHLEAETPHRPPLGIGRQFLGIAHRHGDLAGGQHAGGGQVVHPAHHQGGARCLDADTPEQRRQQGEFDVVGEADAKYPVGAGRLETLGPAHRAGDLVQRRRQQGGDLLGPRRGFHAAPGADEQRIVEQGAQPCQGRADRRLAEKQLFRGTGDAALEHQGLEHDEQVEVDATQIGTVHSGPGREWIDTPDVHYRWGCIES